MTSQRTKKLLAATVLLVVVAFLVAAYYAFMLTRDPGQTGELPNLVEASRARVKLRAYTNALARGDQGFKRFSEVEVNSYLMSLLPRKTNAVATSTNSATAGTNDVSTPTNSPATNRNGTNVVVRAWTNSVAMEEAAYDEEHPPKMHLRKIAVEFSKTNFTLISWGEYRIFGRGTPFVMQRDYWIRQPTSDHDWTLELQGVRIGHVDVPAWMWDRVKPTCETLDEVVLKGLGWSKTVPAWCVTMNDVTKKPEARLYTYKQIPAEDVR